MTDQLTLYGIEAELEALLDSVETCPEELQAELQERIAKYIGAETAKIDNIGRVFSSLDSVQVHAKAEMERLRLRQQRAENAARSLERYILHVLAQRGGQPLKGRTVTLFARRTEALVIDDPAAVPLEWKRTTVQVEIPKLPLKDAVKAGQTIPGVHIEEREHLIRR